MTIEKYAPSPFLQQYILHYWRMKGNLGHQYIRSRDIPDGNIEVILNFGSEFQKIEQKNGVQNYVNGGIKGQFDHAVMIAQTGEVNIIGVSFKPFGFYPFANIDLDEFTNVGAPLEVLLDSSVIDQIHNCSHNLWWVSVLNQYLIRKFNDRNKLHINLVKEVMNLTQKSGRLKVRELSERVNISDKQLERLFKKYVGLTPTRFSRIQRVRQAISALSNTAHPNWFELITQLSFYDQPHFCREFKSIVGVSPTTYFNANDQFSAHYQTKG